MKLDASMTEMRSQECQTADDGDIICDTDVILPEEETD